MRTQPALFTLGLLTFLFGALAEARELVIWNVGQGSWATLIQEQTCDHFDMGGERAPWSEILPLCQNHLNRLHFSHWDWDHVSFTLEARRRFDEICLDHAPGGHAPKGREHLMHDLPPCPRSFDTAEITPPRRQKTETANEASRIFVVHQTALFPGDSTRREEKIWSQRTDELRLVKWLAAGHHGSRTSTSRELLERLPSLKMAVASAREAKYGHPHPEVVARLKEKGVALIRTEEWGHVHIQF